MFVSIIDIYQEGAESVSKKPLPPREAPYHLLVLLTGVL
jgi:hypothetical protein